VVFNYTTTDLATVDYRLKTWSPDEIIYVVDDRQGSHFKKLFLIFARWQPDAARKVRLVHVGFGKILGDNGRPVKTRSGDTVKLGDLLDEAEDRAYKIVSEKSPELPEVQRKEIARVIGLGAVKYADLLPNRQSDYIFSWDKMLALQGNTASVSAIRLRAHAAASSERRKPNPQCAIRNPQLPWLRRKKIALAKHLPEFRADAGGGGGGIPPEFPVQLPVLNLLSNLMRFFENCPVLKADDATRASRLALCDLTARVLKQGLETLGIDTVEQM